jgi:hypothetical protein
VIDDNRPKVEAAEMNNRGELTIKTDQKIQVKSQEEIADAMNSFRATSTASTAISTDGGNRRRSLQTDRRSL